jgi:hypothetical protein
MGNRKGGGETDVIASDIFPSRKGGGGLQRVDGRAKTEARQHAEVLRDAKIITVNRTTGT